MEGATHFVEVWKSKIFNQISETGVLPIEDLKYFLNATKICGNKTIAIWYIKPKTNETASKDTTGSK